jgi:hypothetical protein
MSEQEKKLLLREIRWILLPSGVICEVELGKEAGNWVSTLELVGFGSTPELASENLWSELQTSATAIKQPAPDADAEWLEKLAEELCSLGMVSDYTKAYFRDADRLRAIAQRLSRPQLSEDEKATSEQS